ncbi:MAG: protein-disulfide reductase DsbD [Gammaproteobacteria bacterium]|nr:MAG: protein-disulfide reductase DsbD [Gammaproteobacteria bacterium]
MKVWKLLALVIGLGSSPGFGIDTPEPDLLPPDEAFRITATTSDSNTVQVSWEIADGYYMYRDRMRFSSDTPGIAFGKPDLPAGKIKDDEFFGKIAIYRNQATVSIPITRAAGASQSLSLSAVSQGCADIGVCYPPHTQLVQLELPNDNPGATTTDIPALGALPSLGDRLGLGGSDDEFLDPDEAFQVSISTPQPNLLVAHWSIAEGYYLYRDKFSAQLAEGGQVTLLPPELPAGEIYHDEFFGDVQIFHDAVDMQIPLQRSSGDAAEITLILGYQGCAEAGICYPPIKKQVPVALAAFDPGSTPALPSIAGTTLAAVPQAAPAVNPGVTSRQDDIARVLQESRPGWVALFFFGAGVLLAFTACVYPMIPILSSIIVGHGENLTVTKGFVLSLVYVEAVAITYAVIGVVSAQFGAGVQAFFQNPWILGMFALIFVLLALSMFGFYNLQLPATWQAKLSETSNRQKGGTLLGAGVMGVLSALIVGPCAGPVLIGALIYTSQSGDYLTGALAMFALGNGMGAPLLVIGASGGKLLPKAGGWMDTVKAVFGVVLLGVAILMLERILPGPVTLLLWAMLLIIPAIYMGALDSLPAGVSGWRRFWKGLGVAMLVYGIILILGATTGARDPLRPLRNLTTVTGITTGGEHVSQHLAFRQIKSVEDFTAALEESTRQGKPVMLDFYADWCTYCIKMEDYTFSDTRVQAALANVTLLQADVTANDATDLALLNHFGLFAPPAILFFGEDRAEQRNYRLVGYMDAEDFLEHLKGAIGG